MSMFRVLGIYNFAGGLKIELAKKSLATFFVSDYKNGCNDLWYVQGQLYLAGHWTHIKKF